MRELLAFLLMFGFLGVAAAQAGFVKGTLVDVAKPNSRENSRMQVSVRVGDLVYTGETRSTATREFVIGDAVEVRLTDKYFFLKRSNGKEIKLKIFKRARASESTHSAGAS